MNAVLTAPRQLSKKKVSPEIWTVTDSKETVYCWLDEEGFHTKRFSTGSDGRRNIEHSKQTIKWEDLILKSEGQLKLL